MMNVNGFHERSHVADIELEVWAEKLPTLFEMAAYGMASILKMELDLVKQEITVIKIAAPDYESLLVRFLAELLFNIEAHNFGYESIILQITDCQLEATVQSAPILQMAKEIKAVTWHNLNIQEEAQGFRVRIVFDV